MHTKWKSDFFRNLSNGVLTRLASGCFVETMVYKQEPPQNSRQHVSESPNWRFWVCASEKAANPCHLHMFPMETEPGRRQNKTIHLLW